MPRLAPTTSHVDIINVTNLGYEVQSCCMKGAFKYVVDYKNRSAYEDKLGLSGWKLDASRKIARLFMVSVVSFVARQGRLNM